MTTLPGDSALPTVLDELKNIGERLAKSASRLGDLDAETKNERKLRNRLIRLAVDHGGIPQAQVARWAGIKQPHVTRILSEQDD